MKVAYVNELPPVALIAGSNHELQYDIYDMKTGGSVKDFTVKSFHVYIYSYGYFDHPVLIIDGKEVEGVEGCYIATLTSDDTTALGHGSGLYIQQPVIYDADGKEYRPAQGTINIMPGQTIVHSNNPTLLAEGWPSGEGAYY